MRDASTARGAAPRGPPRPAHRARRGNSRRSRPAERASAQQRDLLAVDAPVEDVDVLRLARQDVKHREAVEIAILQILQRLAEHDRARGAVAVEQRHAAIRVGGQRGTDDRQRPALCRSRRRRTEAPPASRIGREPPLGRHHVEQRARQQAFVGESREAPARRLLDRDAHFRLVRARTDRIAAATFLAAEHRRKVRNWPGVKRNLGLQRAGPRRRPRRCPAFRAECRRR